MLRYAEYLTSAVLVCEGATMRDAFGVNTVRPVAAKLLADVCGFLVTAAGLRPEFRAAARDRLVVDLTGGERAERSDALAGANAADTRDAPARRQPFVQESQLPLDEPAYRPPRDV
jgi:hypothetical protein